ncbi:MAG: membrane dipeptidase, partial [Burkholderiaceae bacterium]|nr:membrane dipeptidase [Burkholderiaceae bacterium]
MRRNLLHAGAALLAVSTSALTSAFAHEESHKVTTTNDAHEAHASHPIIIDGLGGIGNPNDGPPEERADQGIDERALFDAHASGLCAFNQTIGYVFGEGDPFEISVRDIGMWDALIRSRSKDLLKVYSGDDIRLAHASGRIGVILGFQNAAMMGNDAKRIAIFANLGVKVIQLTYNGRNQLGDGSMVKENQGLTAFGREVVHELNRNRVIVDLSHSGEQTCLDAIAASTQPLMITHTGCRAITDLPRNKSDRELRLVAERGGVVGIYFMPFLAIDRQPSADDLIAHIEHALQVCGEDHVSIGTDGSVPRIDDMQRYYADLKKDVDARQAAGIGATGERADIVPFLPDLQGPDKFLRLGDMLKARGHKASVVDKVL